MRNSAQVVLLAAALFGTAQVMAIEPETKVMAQPGAPLQITAYNAAYEEGGRYSTEGIHHTVSYKSIADRPIVAAQIGLVSFDIWNEFLDRTNGVTIEDLAPGATKQGTWVARAYSDFAFHTGVAYVAKVRFADGSIWSADLQAVAQELRKIQADFDVAKLKGAPPKP